MATKLQDIIRKFLSNEILLPDFQRTFVWKDEDMQKRLIASVLTKMPIGSLLELEGQADDYAYKKIGCKENCDNTLTGNVKFLLDGQQRVTVLTNIFSSAIFELAKKENQDLINSSLKRRFFIFIPTFENLNEANDPFCARTLNFPMKDPTNDLPRFLTSTAFNILKVEDCYKTSKVPNPFSPFEKGFPNYANIISQSWRSGEGFFIPLFLLTEENCDSTPNATCLKGILEEIVINIQVSIKERFDKLSTLKEKGGYVSNILSEDHKAYITANQLGDRAIFEKYLQKQANDWANKMYEYLKSCIDKMELAEIVLSSAERDRAIDIYENLNKGGVSLDIFDLVLARVAKVYKGSFLQRIVMAISDDLSKYSRDDKGRVTYSSAKYPLVVLNDRIETAFKNQNVKGDYNASVSLQCLDKDGDPLKVYIDSFLNVLALRYYVNEKKQQFSVDLIKREFKLNITPEFINENCESVCKAIDRALYFFHTRCGIRSISEIHYKFMLDIVSYVLWEDKSYNKKDTHKLLDAWYWASVFSGEFDKDQNAQLIYHLTMLSETINGKRDKKWLDDLKQKVLKMPNFSDKELLLYTNIETTEKPPKDFLRDMICQFYLAETYKSLFDEKIITVFEEEALEKHHIIPLGSTTSIKESTRKIRSDNKNVLNSPLNFIYITKTDNKAISDSDLSTYASAINLQSFAELNFPYGVDKIIDKDSTVKVLEQRYVSLKGRIESRITQNI